MEGRLCRKFEKSLKTACDLARWRAKPLRRPACRGATCWAHGILHKRPVYAHRPFAHIGLAHAAPGHGGDRLIVGWPPVQCAQACGREQPRRRGSPRAGFTVPERQEHRRRRYGFGCDCACSPCGVGRWVRLIAGSRRLIWGQQSAIAVSSGASCRRLIRRQQSTSAASCQ